jgi:hypothetical protein
VTAAVELRPGEQGDQRLGEEEHDDDVNHRGETQGDAKPRTLPIDRM